MSNGIKEAADTLLKSGKITKEEYDSLDFEKVAVKLNSLERYGKFVKTLWPIPVTIGAGVLAKELIVDPIVANQQINASYKSLAEKTPQLAGEDQAKIRDYFDVVRTYSPHSAANPLVAGALVNKMIQFGGVDHKLIQDIIAIQEGKSALNVLPPVITEGAKTLAKASGGGDKTTSIINKIYP